MKRERMVSLDAITIGFEPVSWTAFGPGVVRPSDGTSASILSERSAFQ